MILETRYFWLGSSKDTWVLAPGAVRAKDYGRVFQVVRGSEDPVAEYKDCYYGIWNDVLQYKMP